MGIGPDDGIRVIKADDDLAWEEVPRPEGDTNPPGEEVAVFRSSDATFSTGFWRRVPEEGPMDLPYHEIALILEGEVEVTGDDGTLHTVGPGDVLITPSGTKATWKALSPVRKLWVVYKEPDAV
jgi:uncharacterized cupin superfamily protein